MSKSGPLKKLFDGHFFKGMMNTTMSLFAWGPQTDKSATGWCNLCFRAFKVFLHNQNIFFYLQTKIKIKHSSSELNSDAKQNLKHSLGR